MDEKTLPLRTMKRLAIIIIAVLALTLPCKAQTIADTSIFTPQISLSYAAQLPFGDLKDRFGINSNVGFTADFKLESNWVIGGSVQFFFGNQVKDLSMLDDMYTIDGQIINQNGTFANVVAFERGWVFTGNIGRVFPVIGPNPNSGILLKLGLGYMQHKVRIDGEQDLIPQFVGDYRKLYDRYTSGFVTTQFIGYVHMGNNRISNFYGGIEISEGFTKGQRTAQAGAPIKLQDNRIDILAGLRIGWIVPIHRRKPNEFYFD
ncbi:MAG: hypothetical protein ACI9J3_003056 [Parvicellaceae bacterium]|jgi:hypothetical protein